MSEDLMAEIERLKAENAALKSGAPRERTISMKVSEKGAMSLYGLGRFPVTLYKEQWTKLIEHTEEIKTFLRDNNAQLKSKTDTH